MSCIIRFIAVESIKGAVCWLGAVLLPDRFYVFIQIDLFCFYMAMGCFFFNYYLNKVCHWI